MRIERRDAVSHDFEVLEEAYDVNHPDFVGACELGKQIARMWATKLKPDYPREDFFRVIVEERMRLSSRDDLTDSARQGLGEALKILAAQMDRVEDDEKVEITSRGIEPEAFTCKVANPNVSGEFCFPASLQDSISGSIPQ